MKNRTIFTYADGRKGIIIKVNEPRPYEHSFTAKPLSKYRFIRFFQILIVKIFY